MKTEVKQDVEGLRFVRYARWKKQNSKEKNNTRQTVMNHKELKIGDRVMILKNKDIHAVWHEQIGIVVGVGRLNKLGVCEISINIGQQRLTLFNNEVAFVSRISYGAND